MNSILINCIFLTGFLIANLTNAQSFTVLFCDDGIEHVSKQGVKTKVLPGISLSSGQLIIKKKKYIALYLGNGIFWEKDTLGTLVLDAKLQKLGSPKPLSELIISNYTSMINRTDSKINPVYRCRCLTDLIIYGGQVNKVMKGSDLTLHWVFKNHRATTDKTHIIVKNLYEEVLDQFSTQELEFVLKYDKAFFEEEKSFLIDLFLEGARPSAISEREQLYIRMTTKEEEEAYYKEIDLLDKEHPKKSGILYAFLKAQTCEKYGLYLDATKIYFEIYKKLQTGNEVFDKHLFERLVFRY